MNLIQIVSENVIRHYKNHLYLLGRQFDKYGNLKQWWNNKTIAEFRGAAQCIIEQYNNYTLEPYGLQIDGRLTQGENIADNGGLKQAYRVNDDTQFLNVYIYIYIYIYDVLACKTILRR